MVRRLHQLQVRALLPLLVMVAVVQAVGTVQQQPQERAALVPLVLLLLNIKRRRCQ
jgi:uncharacterized membrane protein YhaH (DUF805 family)